MKVFSSRQVKEIDAYTIRHEPVSSIDLMERAALACSRWISGYAARSGRILVFAGPGNNGGDGMAIARQLMAEGFDNLFTFQLRTGSPFSADLETNRLRLLNSGHSIAELAEGEELPSIQPNDLVIDALFGTGLARALSGWPARVVRHINAAGCRVISIDMPSGLTGEDNRGADPQTIIRATHTLSFQFPKRSFFYAENAAYTGDWHILDIGLHPAVIQELPSDLNYVTGKEIAGMIRKRQRFSHKGTYGHALLIAGSYGMAGAAILAARSCLRSGTGLLTTHVPRSVYPVIQGAVPESVFSLDPSEHCFTSMNIPDSCTALGMGPGTGTDPVTLKAFEKLLLQYRGNLVLDADALNMIAMKKELLDRLPENTVITPHPKEFDRVFGGCASGYERNMLQMEMAVKHRLVVILKGAFSSVALPDGSCHFNSTGNPGMATAGSGDVLTGMVLSFIAQGYGPSEAALLGTYIHGLAGDLAAGSEGQHALIASDIIEYIGKAFIKLENHDQESDC